MSLTVTVCFCLLPEGEVVVEVFLGVVVVVTLGVVVVVTLGVVVVVVVPLEEPALVNSTVTLLRVIEPERLP